MTDLSPKQQALKDEFITNRGYWSDFGRMRSSMRIFSPRIPISRLSPQKTAIWIRRFANSFTSRLMRLRHICICGPGLAYEERGARRVAGRDHGSPGTDHVYTRARLAYRS